MQCRKITPNTGERGGYSKFMSYALTTRYGDSITESIVIWAISDRGLTKWAYSLETIGMDGVDTTMYGPDPPVVKQPRPSRALTGEERKRWNHPLK